MTSKYSETCRVRFTGDRFVRDENGGVAMIFGLMILVISIFAGAGLDFSRSVTARAKLSGALDAAILTAARGLTLGVLDEKDVGEELSRMFTANVQTAFLDDIHPRIAGFELDALTSTIKASAAGRVPAALVQLAGIELIDVGVSSSATFNNDRVEIAMMLDVTGSMNQKGKMSAMKKAATLAIDTIIPTGKQADPDKVRIALIPYSQGVNAGKWAKLATNNASKKCATERVGRYAFTDESPKKEAIGNGSTNCPSAAIVPLELDSNTLKSKINAFSAGGWTSGNVGIAWTWYALSQKWNGLWPAGSDASASGAANVHKYAILMTDGEFNTVYDKSQDGKYTQIDPNVNAAYSIAQSNERAIELCSAMKKDRIVVFTIAFDLKDPNAVKTLKACKSDNVGYRTFYSAASQAELENAYLEIASLIQNMWLSQ